MLGAEPEPAPPIKSSCWNRSSAFCTGTPVSATHTERATSGLPSQLNFTGSNWTFAILVSATWGMLRLTMPMTVPSFGAIL